MQLFWFLSLFLPFILFAQDQIIPKPPQEIQRELDADEVLFRRAKSIFNPWYTGPLITPGVSMMPVGVGNSQPYLFVNDNYAVYDKHRKSIKLPSDLLQLKGTINIQTGITKNFDLNLNFLGQGNWQLGRSGGGFGDMSLVGGFLINTETPYSPGAKLTITQIFPTGHYKNLSNILNGIGEGAYSTQFGLGFSKVILWNTPHPMNLRCFFGYQISTIVNVSGINSYGGGLGCKGRVRPGNTFSADFGAEFSFTKKWVAAIDVVYSAANRTKFHGNPGTIDGFVSSVGNPYQDNLSLAPAIEYNFNANVGLIAGAWFSVYGRSSANFASGIISLTYSFP